MAQNCHIRIVLQLPGEGELEELVLFTAKKSTDKTHENHRAEAMDKQNSKQVRVDSDQR